MVAALGVYLRSYALPLMTHAVNQDLTEQHIPVHADVEHTEDRLAGRSSGRATTSLGIVRTAPGAGRAARAGPAEQGRPAMIRSSP